MENTGAVVQEEKRAKPIKRYKECVIEIRGTNLPNKYAVFWNPAETVEERQRREIMEYENWAKDFRDFLRHHRSQDVQDVIVNRITETVCSACGREWDTYSEDGKNFCGYCGLEVE